MIHLGLIGYPLGHSLSPKVHTAALRSCGLEGDYSLFPIRPDDTQGLKELFARVRSGELTGLNVTIPHKQNVIELMDELTPTAKAVGAVSTIYLKANTLIGDNTDAPGFLRDLKKFLEESPSPVLGRVPVRVEGLGVREKSALVLGAGGSARAVVYALLNAGWNVTLAARRLEQAEQLTNSFPDHKIQIMTLTDLGPSTFDLLVNTMPLGMTPDVDRSPWPENLAFPPHAAIYDLVYNPRETKFVKDARAAGLRATTGLGMLVEQAALAFTLWTGQAAPREIMFSAVEEV